MTRPNLIDALHDRPLLCDGAMGTQLMAAGLPTTACGELWNVEHPDRVEAIHRAYLDAGCDMVITNTFGGCRAALAMHGLSDRAAELNRAAAALARRAAGDDRWVLGDVGPFGGFLEPIGDTTVGELTDIFLEQITALHAGGADAAIIETMADPNELAAGVRAARQVADWPVLATCAFQRAGDRLVTMMGVEPADTIHAALDAGAQIVGANCGTDLTLDDYADLADQLVAAAQGAPVILQANAGSPNYVDGQTVFPATPDDFADAARRFLDLGVRVIGGCCGTSPEHLAAVRRALLTA